MRFIFGLIVGVALTIGSAAIHDSMEPSPVVNWTEFFLDGMPGLINPGLLMKLSVTPAENARRL